MTEVRVYSMIKAGVINKYSQVCKKKERKKKHLRRVFLNYL